MKLIQGNEACALGAMDAGCRFYAGYPITPASEIMEWMARKLPALDGTFVQMEDEIASLAAVIGASWAGKKAMTATSGPGFSLMQEHVGYAAMTETPCVIVDSQRGGPSTGLPTLPSQGDVMQARWGTHGDHPVIVLTASSVRGTYTMTVQAFNLSETYRVPVILLLDATISHMRENVELPEMQIVERDQEDDGREELFGHQQFLPFGVGPRKVVTGLAHDEKGEPETSQGHVGERLLKKSMDRLQNDMERITFYNTYQVEDAEWLVLSYGITSRPARAAVERMRKEGEKIGLLDLQTLWPFPEELVQRFSEKVHGILVPELNLGQLIMPIRASIEGRAPVFPFNRSDGKLFTPDELMDALHEIKFNGEFEPVTILNKRRNGI